MNAKALVLAAAALIAGTAALSAGANPYANQPQITFDKEVFEAIIRDSMTFPSARGFSAVVIRNGQFVQEVSGGLAQDHPTNNALDVPFTMNVPSNIGSTIKVMSFIALLRVFESGAQGRTLQQWLNTPIVPYLPGAWRNYVNAQPGAAHQALRNVTFRQLMQHRSGWGAKPGPIAFNRIQSGVDPNQFGQRQYQNINASIVTYLLPRVLNPQWAAAVDQKAIQQGIAIDDEIWYAREHGFMFEGYMRSMFAAVLPTPIWPSCDPQVDYGFTHRKFAYSYSTPFGGTGEWYSEKQTNGGCGAQGGYYMSMREMAQFWATFQATENILKNSTKALMYDDLIDPTTLNQLGWARIVASPFLKQNFNVNGSPSHNGAHMGYKAAMIDLPAGYMAMIATNQSLVNASQLEDLLKNAFAEAVRHNFE